MKWLQKRCLLCGSGVCVTWALVQACRRRNSSTGKGDNMIPRIQLLFLQCICTLCLHECFVVPQSRRSLQMDHAAGHTWSKVCQLLFVHKSASSSCHRTMGKDQYRWMPKRAGQSGWAMVAMHSPVWLQEIWFGHQIILGFILLQGVLEG